MVLVGTVESSNAVEAVTLRNTGEALTLGGAEDVDLLAGFEELYGELLAQLVRVSICSAQFDDVTASVTPAFSK